MNIHTSKSKAAEVFKAGINGIGYVGSDFTKRFGERSCAEGVGTPTHQILPRYMSDATIERDLKPGYCTLGDVLAVIQSDEYRDGELNLFYFEECVAGVYWGSSGWRVYTWDRVGCEWSAGIRVFSPQLDSPTLGTQSAQTLVPSDPVAVPDELTINGQIYRKI